MYMHCLLYVLMFVTVGGRRRESPGIPGKTHAKVNS